MVLVGFYYFLQNHSIIVKIMAFFSFKTHRDMLIEMVNLFFKITYKRFESASTYFSMRIKLFNLQINPMFGFAFIFVHVPWELVSRGDSPPPFTRNSNLEYLNVLTITLSRKLKVLTADIIVVQEL